MQQKSLDGIRAIRKATPQKITYITPLLTPQPLAKQPRRFWAKFITPVTVVALVIFGFGFVVLNNASIAETGDETAQTVANQAEATQQESTSQNDAIAVFLNTSISLLPQYRSAAENQAKIEERKAKLKTYLEDRKSPFAEDDLIDTIARQEHWKLILAIANAESSLGKHCTDQNCSGIGVAPGTPTWRKYKAIKNWVLDLNRLLEKSYSTSTLTDMCGVYVQPCNQNWLIATHQIIDELDQRGIN